MTPLPFFQVDAFADRPFTGNPAAVMPLDHWLPAETMQAIAAENNLSETAFTVPSESEGAVSAPSRPADVQAYSNANWTMSVSCWAVTRLRL